MKIREAFWTQLSFNHLSSELQMISGLETDFKQKMYKLQIHIV